jgi:hypothetical protein
VRAFQSEANGLAGVQNVQKVQSVQTPSFLLPRDAGEDTGGGFNGLNILNAMRRSAYPLDHTMSAFDKIRAVAKEGR